MRPPGDPLAHERFSAGDIGGYRVQRDHAVLILEPHVRCPRVTEWPASAVVSKYHFWRCGHVLSLQSPRWSVNEPMLPLGADAPGATAFSMRKQRRRCRRTCPVAVAGRRKLAAEALSR